MPYEHHFIDNDPGYDGWGAVAVADFDGDGRPEFATGGKGGGIYCLFDFLPEERTWKRHIISEDFSPNVGAAVLDVSGRGRPGIVCGEWGDRLLWFDQTSDGWKPAIVGSGLDDPHDVLCCDVNGDGRDEVIVREKDGRLMVWTPAVEGAWDCQVVASGLPGDGTAVASIAVPGVLDLVTNEGWFENVNGDGSSWVRHPLIPEELDWHPESRLVVGDIDGDGQPEAAITESEIGPARLAILKPRDRSRPWRSEVILDRNLDLRGLHSLEIVDLDGDGRLEIFTAEMENGKTDGVASKPKWMVLRCSAHGDWKTETLLNVNLGTHSAASGDFDGDGRLELVGKVWRANGVNGNGGRNHIDWLKPST